MRLLRVMDDDERRRRAVWSVPTPLCVLGTVDTNDTPHLMNISWVTPVANEPSTFVMSVERDARSHQLLLRRGAFTLSMLDATQREWGRAFVKPTLDYDAGPPEMIGPAEIARSAHGAPYLVAAASVLAGTARHLEDVGTHALWLGELEEVAVRDDVLEGPASAHAVKILGVHDTRMNYGR